MHEVITDNLDLWSSALLTKSTAGRGSNGKMEAYGIKKLRELILELAVRGKLVPQDGDWSLTCLGDLGEWAVGSGFPKVEQGNEGLEILFAKVSDMNLPENAKFIVITNHTISKETAHKLGVNVHPTGTVIFPKIGGAIATNKRRVLSRPTAIDNNCLGIIPKAEVSTDWLYLALSGIDFTKYQAGTSVPALSQGVLAKIPAMLPPIAEQHRIVAKVDQLMALCDRLGQKQTSNIEAHQALVETLLGTLTSAPSPEEFAEAWTRIADYFDTLFTTEQSIDQLKQTILQLAVMGKLVPQDPNDEPASVLLERIASKTRQLVKEGKIKKEIRLPDVLEKEEPYKIPTGWKYVRLGNITNKIGSGSTPRGGESAYINSGIPFLRSQNVWNHGIEMNDVAFISKATHEKMSNTVVEPNDILLNITGASLGRCAIYPERAGEANVSQHVTIIRPTETETSRYLHYCILSPYIQSLVWGRQVGMAREGLSKKVLEQFEIPLPPLAEQHRIVAKVDELMALCDALKARLADAQTTQIQLADAIVEQAVA